MSRPSEKVKAHGRCRPHLLGSCLKANGDGLLLLIWGIKTFLLYLFSRSRGAWHLCDVPDPGFIPACVSNVAFFTMCHCQGTCKSTTIMGSILEKWSDLSTHAYVVTSKVSKMIVWSIQYFGVQARSRARQPFGIKINMMWIDSCCTKRVPNLPLVIYFHAQVVWKLTVLSRRS